MRLRSWVDRLGANRRDRQRHRRGACAVGTRRAGHRRGSSRGQRRFEDDTAADMACQHGSASRRPAEARTPGGQIVLAGLPNLWKFRAFPQPLRAVLGWHGRALDQELRQIGRRRLAVMHVAMPPVSWPEMFAEDRFHPNAAAYRRLAAHFGAALITHG
jgi:hypothetical protein